MTHLSDGEGPAGPLTLCIVNYQGESSLPATLRAATAQRELIAQVLLVDNGSTDRSLELARRDFPDVEALALPENRGPGAARNAGFRAAAHDQILFADNDVELAPGCAGTLLRALQSDPRALAAMPRVLYGNDRSRVQYEGAGCHYLGAMTLYGGDAPLAGRASGVREINSLVTACFLIDRGRWRGGPLFDEAFFMYFEDHDLGVRARVAGHVLLSVPEALCYHGRGTAGLALRSTGAYHPFRVVCTIRNRWQVLLKNYAARTLLVLAPALLAYEVAQMAAVARKGWGRHWLRALGWILAHLPDLAERRRLVQRTRLIPDREILEGGPLPLAPQLTKGRLERAGKEVVNRMVEAYWRIARGYI